MFKRIFSLLLVLITALLKLGCTAGAALVPDGNTNPPIVYIDSAAESTQVASKKSRRLLDYDTYEINEAGQGRGGGRGRGRGRGGRL